MVGVPFTFNWIPVCYSHPDQQYVKYIHTGLLQGFHISFDKDNTSLRSSAQHHPLATENQLLVSEYMKSEVECERLEGPVHEDLVPLIKISLIGLIPKPH